MAERLQIEYRRVDSLNPYKNNPRHNDAAVPAVAESIREFGFKIPIVIDNDGVIVCGHTRLKAAKLIGMDEVPCIIASDLTDEQIKAFRLADNKVGEIATWDDELLNFELSGIASINMADFGFDMSLAEEKSAEDVEEDEFDEEVPEETDIQPGDIFRLGDHRLICGDGTSADVILAVLGGAASGYAPD